MQATYSFFFHLLLFLCFTIQKILLGILNIPLLCANNTSLHVCTRGQCNYPYKIDFYNHTTTYTFLSNNRKYLKQKSYSMYILNNKSCLSVNKNQKQIHQPQFFSSATTMVFSKHSSASVRCFMGEFHYNMYLFQ